MPILNEMQSIKNCRRIFTCRPNPATQSPRKTAVFTSPWSGQNRKTTTEVTSSATSSSTATTTRALTSSLHCLSMETQRSSSLLISWMRSPHIGLLLLLWTRLDKESFLSSRIASPHCPVSGWTFRRRLHGGDGSDSPHGQKVVGRRHEVAPTGILLSQVFWNSKMSRFQFWF